MDISIVEKLLSGLHDIPQNFHTFCLHGGEPLLIGKKWFSSFIKLISDFNATSRGVTVSIAVQTNGLLIDQEWIELFKSGSIGVSVSIDGPEIVHDYARVDSSNNGTHARVLSNIESISKNGIAVGAIAVLTKKTMEISPSEFFDYFQKIPLKNGLDITPYIETGSSDLELKAAETYEATSEQLTTFLKDLFDIWLYHSCATSRIDIRMFEQLVGILLDFIPTLCNLTQGASCGKTPSILPNGDVLACDLDAGQLNFKLGSLLTGDIKTICSPENLNELHNSIISGYQSRGCDICDIARYCGLTCPRHTFSNRDHSGYCKMMKALVTHAKDQLNNVSSNIFSETIDFH